MATVRTKFGSFAESCAEKFLVSKGYRIIDRNYRKPWGELDIIADKDGVLSFIEVKASKTYLSGFEPELRANRTKMVKVVRTARSYLVAKKYSPDQEWRLDIISVVIDKDRGVAKIKHFKNIDI
jgi:putative endonuclease